MKIEVVQTIDHPRARVWEAYRDRLQELAEYLPNIARIEVLEREEPEDGVVKLLNRWQAANTEVPAVARPFVDPKRLNWLDHATWHQADWRTEWRMEVPAFGDRVRTAGSNVYFEEGPNRTRLEIRGEFSVDVGKLPGVPRFLAGKVGGGVEKFVVALITPNFTKVNRALQSYLDEHPVGG